METDQAEALELSKGLPATASNIERVAKKTSQEAAQWAFTQWALRKKAIEKGFPKAEEMLFTREALEQASHFAVARYHASLFPRGELVADLTCGIGADLIALAERGPVIGYEIDAERLEYANHNLKAHGFSGDLRLVDCLSTDWDFQFAIADPNRRLENRRTLDVEQFNPSPRSLAERMSSLQLGLIKLSPMLSDDVLSIFGSRVEFLSNKGQCPEALVFCGKKAGLGVAAVRVTDGAQLLAGDALPSIDEPLEFLFEADAAAIRAHAMSFIQGPQPIFGVGDSNGYLTSSARTSSDWISPYHVIASGNYDAKSVKAKLRQIGGGKPIIKTRARGVDIRQVQRELTTEGSLEPVVALYSVGPSIRYAILEPMPK